MKARNLFAVSSAAALVLAGCGSTAHPLVRVVGAAAKTSEGSVWWDLNLADAHVGGAHVTVVGRGAAAFTRGIGYLAVNTPTGVEYILFTPTVVYLRPVPAGLARLPSGRDLITAPLEPAVDRWLPGLVGQVESLNPKLLLDLVALGTESASSQGTEVVNHIPLSKYTATVSLARAKTRATGAQRLAIADEQAALGPRSLAVTVWIDASDRVARIRATPPGGELGTATYALTNYRQINVFGRAMNIQFGTNKAPILPDISRTIDVRVLSHPRASPLTGFGAG